MRIETAITSPTETGRLIATAEVGKAAGTQLSASILWNSTRHRNTLLCSLWSCDNDETSLDGNEVKHRTISKGKHLLSLLRLLHSLVCQSGVPEENGERYSL